MQEFNTDKSGLSTYEVGLGGNCLVTFQVTNRSSGAIDISDDTITLGVYSTLYETLGVGGLITHLDCPILQQATYPGYAICNIPPADIITLGRGSFYIVVNDIYGTGQINPGKARLLIV